MVNGPAMVNGPGVHFPPPFLLAGAFLAGLALERWVFRLALADGPLRTSAVAGGWLLALSGLALAAWGLVTFFRSRTAIMPNRPATRVVSSGPYRFSRNPMYVGLTALYAGLALTFDVAWPLVLLPLALVALQRLVIRREERYLSAAFGAEYDAYRARVRRWL